MKTQTYTITVITNDDGSTQMKRVNDGFSGIELIGIVAITSHELMKQLQGKLKPDIIKREVIKD